MRGTSPSAGDAVWVPTPLGGGGDGVWVPPCWGAVGTGSGSHPAGGGGDRAVLAADHFVTVVLLGELAQGGLDDAPAQAQHQVQGGL